MLLLVALLEALGLVSPAVELNVSDTGDDADAGSAVTPLRSIATALTQGTATRAAGQRLTIRCSGTLREPGLDLPENVTLVGPATILCTAPQPAVRIAAAGVELRDLTLTGGAGHTGDGGAVLVTGTSDVTLERCELLGSTAGRGGGLAVLTSRQVKSAVAASTTTAPGRRPRSPAPLSPRSSSSRRATATAAGSTCATATARSLTDRIASAAMAYERAMPVPQSASAQKPAWPS